MAVAAGGIGARLRAGREKLGLTVLQVAERIHTDPKIVDAIEAENYEALGAPVYARGHIRHYADLVGEAAGELIALYSDSSKVAQPDLTRIVKVPAGSASSKLVAPALVVIAVFAVAGAVWWVSALSKKKPQLSDTHVVGEESPTAASAPESAPPTDATETVQGQPVAPGTAAGNAAQGRGEGAQSGGTAGQGRVAVAPSGTSGQQGRGGAAPSGTAAMRSAASGGTATTSGAATASGTTMRGRSGAGTPEPQGPASAAGRAGSTAAPVASPQGRSAAAVPAGPPATSAPTPAKNQAQVTLHYSADSWTEVYDASGARLFYDVGAANSVQTVVGTPPLRVVLGNASGVAVDFNGHHTQVAKLARPDGSVQFSINRSGRVVRAKPVGDGG